MQYNKVQNKKNNYSTLQSVLLCIHAGFTFSFPMVQEGLKRGVLVTWTKSFACPDGVGEDAVKMLEDAIERRGVSEHVHDY